ncbi:MAG: flagellar hook-basal body complex protein [Alphaproteobacteria bacterium]|nr:flagellar hook-basal body complex protein [Alphaproteobacteria bacterium]
MTLASFIPSVSGMTAMATAQQSVSENIANMSTTGYKQNETLFHTLLGSSGLNVGSQSGLSSSRASICGVDAYNRTNIGIEGIVKPTGNAFDVAFSGNSNAFFMLDDGYDNLFYSRAGDFHTINQGGKAYLMSSGGLYVQGFSAINGNDEFNNTPSDIVFENLNRIEQKETTEASIIANVPAKEVDSSIYSFYIYSKNYNGSNLNMVLKKVDGMKNTWDVLFETEDGKATSETLRIVFNEDGTIKTPKNIKVAINWNDGSSSNLDIDISKMTQFAANSQISNIQQNGTPSGDLLGFAFDKDGILRANYTNGDTYTIAKLAIVGFTSPENLTPYNTTLFEANGETGNSYYANSDGLIVPESLESSTVNLEKEFSQMIVVQRAYSLNTQSFTVNDEMLSLLVDLKS